MAELTNSFEGGSDSTGITTGNSGGSSGDAFDSVFATGTAVFSNANLMNGSLVAKLDAPTSGNNCILTWNTTSWTASSVLYVRMYFRVNDPTPASNLSILYIRQSNGSTLACDVQLRTTGIIGLRIPTTLRHSGGHTIVADTWYRLEVRAECVTGTTMNMQARLYSGNDSSPIETIGDTTAYTAGNGTIGGTGMGIVTSAGQASYQMLLDDVGISDADWLGSAVTPTTASAYWGIVAGLGTFAAPVEGFGVGAFGTTPFGTG